MAYEFWEMDGYPQESEDVKSFRAIRKVRCAWNDRTWLRRAFMLHPGQLYPYALSFGARVIGVGIEPFGKQHQDQIAADLAWYEEALLTIQYATPSFGDPRPYPESKDPTKFADRASTISETLEGFTEAFRLLYEDFVWSNNQALEEEETPVIVRHRVSYVLTRHNLPLVPQAIIDLGGKINADPVTPILVGMDSLEFAPETLLMAAPVVGLSSEDDPAAGGRVSYDLTLRMIYHPETWYKFWHARSKDFLTLHERNSDGTAGTQYKEPEIADFSVAFP